MHKYKSRCIKVLLSIGSLSIILTSCVSNTTMPSDNTATGTTISESGESNNQNDGTYEKTAKSEKKRAAQIVETTSGSATQLAKLVTSVSYMAVDALTSYQTSSAKADLQYLQDGWALDDEEALSEACIHLQRYLCCFLR